MYRHDLSVAVRAALEAGYHDILSHIAKVQTDKRYTDIEKTFAKFFVPQLADAYTERPGRLLNAIAHWPGRESCRIDVALGAGSEGPFHTAFELKAVRMPRRAGKGALFDVGQIESDFRKLQFAELEDAWLIAFVYGPLADDARTDGELFTSFHRQMFVDVALSGEEAASLRAVCIDELQWNKPQSRQSNDRFAVLYRQQGAVSSLGAVCYCVPRPAPVPVTPLNGSSAAS